MRFLLSILISFVSVCGFAHQDFYVIKDYGNVKVRIVTGYKYEEINKVLIIAQLAEKLSKELNFEEQLFLDFTHNYTDRDNPKTDYFLSFDKGGLQYTDSDFSRPDIFNKKIIVIRQAGKQFDIVATLKLIEYSIKNYTSIEKQQKKIYYKKSYNEWTLKTIEQNILQKITEAENSTLVNSVIKNKIYRPDYLNKEEIEFTYGVSYYWQNNKFHLFSRDIGEDVDIITLDDICYFYDLEHVYVVFDSNNSFYHIHTIVVDHPTISDRQIIIDVENNYRPYFVNQIGGNNISIYLWNYEDDRTLIYLANKKILIQDLDKLIEKDK